MLFQLVALWASFEVIRGHGRLIEPPSRSTMWRYGFKTPPNYNDHELFCGGLARMIRNGGQCGICGDPADQAPPRPNEVGGRYANGVVVRRYASDAKSFDVAVEITAFHRGHFEFKMCPTNNRRVDPTQQCFDEHVLRLADGSGRSEYWLPEPQDGGVYRLKYALPDGITKCSFCVLQWTYVAANNWGRCANGTEGIGCGHQETFRACADIAIGVDADAAAADDDDETNEISRREHSSAPNSVLRFGRLAALLITSVAISFEFLQSSFMLKE